MILKLNENPDKGGGATVRFVSLVFKAKFIKLSGLSSLESIKYSVQEISFVSFIRKMSAE